jgi:hypothetical protein
MQRRLLLVAAGLIALLAGCGQKDPFSYVKISGKVTYEDGSTLPAVVQLRFYPQSPPLDGKTYPRVGAGLTDAEGKYRSITSHLAGDGVVRGKHNVTLSTPKGGRLPPDMVPPEYNSFDKTPLLVDTADPRTFNLKIRKPTTK